MSTVKNTGKLIYKHRFAVLFVLLFITMCNFYYFDLNSNIRQGMNIWEALFSGRFFEYYSLNIESRLAGQMDHQANYGMLLNVVNGLWMLPLYIIEKLMGDGVNILDFFVARLWGKLLMFVCLWVSAVILYRLARLLGFKEERAETVSFLYLSSTLVILSAINASQIDVLGLCLILLAMYYLIKEDFWKFLIFFVISVQFKDFAFLIFLPVILLREKNLFKALGTLASPFVLSFFISLPFKIADPAGTHALRSRFWIMLDWLTRSRVQLVGDVEIPLVFLVMGALAMYAYFKVLNVEEQKHRADWYIYLASVSMLPIMICTTSNAHWCIYIVPFYLLVMMKRREKLFIRLVLETVGTYGLTGAYMLVWDGVFGHMNGMLADKILPGEIESFLTTEEIKMILKKDQYFHFWTLTFAAFIVWALCYAWYNHPGRVKEYFSDAQNPALENVPAGPGMPLLKAVGSDDFWTDGTKQSLDILMWLRAVGGVLLCNAMVFVHFLVYFLR